MAKAEADKKTAEAAALKQAQVTAKAEAARLAASAAASKAGPSAPLPTSASGAAVLGGRPVLVQSSAMA
jgi:hypothetical protein